VKKVNPLYKAGNVVFVLAFSTGMMVYQPQRIQSRKSSVSDKLFQPQALTQTGQQQTDTPETVTCPEDPPMGERAKLLDDQEIGLIFNTENIPESFYYALDNPRESHDLVYIDDMSCHGGACKLIQSPAITMADWNDQFIPVLAYRDSEKRVALGIPSEDGVIETWYSELNNSQGKNVDWIDIAAGNLDGIDTGDESEEVVLAFRDDSKALNVLAIKNIEVPNRAMGYYRDDSSNGRGKVKYVSVATGDLNGDGYNNEIITAFKDGNNHLQAMIFKKVAGKKKLQVLWSRSWTNNYRDNIANEGLFGIYLSDLPIDVTTGDIDGDFKDEAIVAFRDGYRDKSNTACENYQPHGFVQLLVLDGIDEKTYDDQVWAQVDTTTDCPKPNQELLTDIWTPTVSIAAADLDGDGGDELALAFSTSLYMQTGQYSSQSHRYKNLWTFDFVDVSDPEYKGCLSDDGNDMVPCLQDRHHKWIWNHGGDWDVDRISMDAGDLDRDGIAEIAVGITDIHKNLHIHTYDANEELTRRTNMKIEMGDEMTIEFKLAMKDIDGDAVYGNYTNNHYVDWNSYVESVVHSPPYWTEDNDRDTSAAFGSSVGHGGGSGQTSETSMGGSVTVKAQFHDVGPSFTAEYEKSCAVEQTDMIIQTEGTTVKTVTPFEDEEYYYMDAVGYSMCPRCCYDYIENAYNTPVTICLPQRPCSQAKSGLDAWYKDRAHAYPPEGVGDSWVPVGMNFARGMPTEQSSIAYGGVSSRAVDGNTDGDFANGSVTFTDIGSNNWWGVDMLIIPSVHAVQIWNRTDAEPERLSNFYVFLSEEPFSSNDPDVLRQDPNVWHYYHEGEAERLTTAAWSDFRDHNGGAPERSRELTGRYVRVQLTSSRTLSLAEVQVWGVPSMVDQWPVGEPSSTDPISFTVELPGGGSQLVDGEFILKRSGTLHVDDQGSPEFDNSIEEEWEQMTETSTAVEAKVGFSIKVIEGEVTAGSKNVRSRIMTWSKETEFSGEAGMVHENPHYEYAPYMWLQRQTSSSGLEQAFLVLDYWVPYIQPTDSPEHVVENIPEEQAADITPQTPLIDSTTHPSGEAWYESSTVTFNWMQPAGDPATVVGYHWYLDRFADTIPPTYNSVLTTTYTYNNLDDGVWYLHVRAKGESGLWSDTAHRVIQIDTRPAEVELVKDPSSPSGHSGWYNTPVLVHVNAQDLAGSGVETVEVSTDNAVWMPYSDSILFDSDTAGTTLWARAVDQLSHVSEPISTTFKIDQTQPDSRVSHGHTPGLMFAEIVNDDMGNEHALLAGTVEDELSGQAGMDIEVNNNDWTSTVQETAEFWYEFPHWIADKITWIYDSILEISRGNHSLKGYSLDHAGNLEEIYNIGDLLWFPQTSPDFRGSSLTANPSVTHPGGTVDFVAAIRNRGNQESFVQLSDTLPDGMRPVIDLLPTDVDYDESTRTLTWPARLMWPGEWHRYHFRVLIDDGLGAVELQNDALVHAYWPNSDNLPFPQRRRFEELEQTVEFSTSVSVGPGLPDGEDVSAPWVFLNVLGSGMETDPQVELFIRASDDARWMLIREWVLDASSSEWVIAQNSGWLPYNQSHPWTLSPGAGVKYIGVWAADGENNISTLDEHSLDFTNYLTGAPLLADGQRHQYRIELEPGNLSIFNLVADSGDPDLYVWDPYHALLPNYAAEADQLVDVVGFYPILEGMHLFEVIARGESSYQLLPNSPETADEQSTIESAGGGKTRPEYPLTVSTPLSSGAWITPDFPDYWRIYMPIISNH
jgi:uncharacterized repeat protein (TIGR01451 family)